MPTMENTQLVGSALSTAFSLRFDPTLTVEGEIGLCTASDAFTTCGHWSDRFHLVLQRMRPTLLDLEAKH